MLLVLLCELLSRQYDLVVLMEETASVTLIKISMTCPQGLWSKPRECALHIVEQRHLAKEAWCQEHWEHTVALLQSKRKGSCCAWWHDADHHTVYMR